jgi:hypothetical protein
MENTSQPGSGIKQTIIIKNKSVGVALLLTFLFGPLGMFYSTVTGAIVMLIVTVIAVIFTLGIGCIITWPICMIWAAIAASNHNKVITV